MQNLALPTLTPELVRRIERMAAPNLAPATSDLSVPTVAQFGQTIASKARGGAPANKVFCFNHTDLEHLDAILAFYAEDQLEPWFYLTPLGFSREVAAALTKAGFAQREFDQAVLYGLPLTEEPQLPPGMAIERVTAANLEAYVQTFAAGFEWPDEWRDLAIDGMRTSFKPEAYHFLARFDGEPAGVGTLTMRGEVASLGGGAVLPRFRRRGCQQALLNYRLYLAHTLGSSFVLSGAAYGSASFRNQHRAGLQVVYIESGWSRSL